MTKTTQIKALETGSGIAWEEWKELLDPKKELDHTMMAQFVLEKIQERGVSKSPEWWAQGVTVAYEQYIGRREPGQGGDGSFSVTVTKTVPGDMDAVLAWWLELVDGIDRFDGVKTTGNDSTSHTEKWRYWRTTLDDGSKISVNIQTKPGGVSSMVAVNHDKLPDAESVEQKRDYWKKFIS